MNVHIRDNLNNILITTISLKKNLDTFFTPHLVPSDLSYDKLLLSIHTVITISNSYHKKIYHLKVLGNKFNSVGGHSKPRGHNFALF